jgi:hypothetical protein
LRETLSCVGRFANSNMSIKAYLLNDAFSNIQNSQIHFETSFFFFFFCKYIVEKKQKENKETNLWNKESGGGVFSNTWRKKC